MKARINEKTRKELESKLKAVLSDRMQTLSKELQAILLDDLVTAFENRLNVLKRTQTGVRFATDLTACVRLEQH
jgi:hypothetical protein